MLEEAEINIERHLQHFKRGTPDKEWLPYVGKNGWALLTTDKRIRHHHQERNAVIENKVYMFYFSTNELNGEQMADAISKALPKIMKIIDSNQSPLFAAITKKGEVYLKEWENLTLK